MNIFVGARLIWFVCGLAISVICTLHVIPFVFNQLVLGNLFPSWKAAAGYLPLLLIVAIVLMGLSVVQSDNREEKQPLQKFLVGVAIVFPGLAALLANTGLPVGNWGWALGLLGALIVIVPSALDLHYALRRQFTHSFRLLSVRDKDWHLFISLILTSLLCILLMGDFYDQIGPCILAVLMVAMIVYGGFTFLFRLAERSSRPLLSEWMFLAITLGIYLYWLFSARLFPSIAFAGPAQTTYSAALAAAILIFLLGLTPNLKRMGPDQKITGLHLLLAPLAARTWWKGFSMIIAIVAAQKFLTSRIAPMDWSFLGQKAIIITSALFLFANVYWLLPVKSPKWFRIPYPILAGCVVLALFAAQKKEITKSSAQRNVLYDITKSVLTSVEGQLPENFFRYLQANSNIPKTVQIQPVDVQLSFDQRTSGFLSPTLKPKYNVIMVVIDSLRHDYISPYNPRVKFTPGLEEFAKNSIVFDRSFTRYGATGLSEPSIWIGGMMVHQQYVQPFEKLNSLQKMLNANGYHILLSLDTILKQIITPGPNITEIDPGVSTQDLDLCKTLPKLLTHFEEYKKVGPVFAYTQAQNIHISVLNRNGPPAENKNYPGFYSPYAESLNRLDGCFGEFISALKNRGLYDETVIVFTADHGDSLGEEGRFGHGYTIFPEVVRIPMIIHLPESLKGQLEWNPKQVAFSVDLTPSLYYIMGHQTADDSWVWGKSLFWPKGTNPKTRNHEPYLMASSYGAVYGILDKDGTELYIADAVNLTDHAYDLRSDPPVSRRISSEERVIRQRQIRSRIKDINQFYGFRGP